MAITLISSVTPSRVPRVTASMALSGRPSVAKVPSVGGAVSGIINRATMTAAGVLMIDAASR